MRQANSGQKKKKNRNKFICYDVSALSKILIKSVATRYPKGKKGLPNVKAAASNHFSAAPI